METDNRLIAEFMGFELQNNPNERWFNQWFTKETLNKPYNSRIEILHFDTDWNWLMEVVEKIENIEDENRCSKYNFEMVQTFVEIIDNNNSDTIVEIDKNTKIQATYKAVVEFIKWYNEQK